MGRSLVIAAWLAWAATLAPAAAGAQIRVVGSSVQEREALPGERMLGISRVGLYKKLRRMEEQSSL